MHTLSVRLPRELKAWLDRKAADEGRSMNRQIIQLIKSAKESEERSLHNR